MARINKQLQREISLLLESRVKKDTVRDAIITGVECSRDLERAKVFFTAMDPKKRPALLGELQSVKGVLRTLLGQSMRLRHIPALEFVVDESSDYGQRIDAILDRLGLNTGPSPRSGNDVDPEKIIADEGHDDDIDNGEED